MAIIRAALRLFGAPLNTFRLERKINTAACLAQKYPNTPVGIQERTAKRPKEAPKPMQTPYPPFPEGKNPKTGETGGPTGPEPTRFGDWERKGRVSDF